MLIRMLGRLGFRRFRCLGDLLKASDLLGIPWKSCAALGKVLGASLKAFEDFLELSGSSGKSFESIVGDSGASWGPPEGGSFHERTLTHTHTHTHMFFSTRTTLQARSPACHLPQLRDA